MRRLPHLCITHMHTQINILSIAVPTRIQLVLSSREIHCRTGRPQTRTILESQIDSKVYALLVVSFFYDNNSTKLFVLKRKFRFKSIYVEYKGSVSLSPKPDFGSVKRNSWRCFVWPDRVQQQQQVEISGSTSHLRATPNGLTYSGEKLFQLFSS